MACEQENGGPRKTEEEGGGNFRVALFGDFQKKKNWETFCRGTEINQVRRHRNLNNWA